MNGSASPKAAIGPVRGLTWPILMTRDWAFAGSTRSTAGAATAPSPAAMTRRLMVPGCFMATSLGMAQIISVIGRFVGWATRLHDPGRYGTAYRRVAHACRVATQTRGQNCATPSHH